MGKKRRFLIDRAELPYDAFVPDPSFLIPIDEEEPDSDEDDGQNGCDGREKSE